MKESVRPLPLRPKHVDTNIGSGVNEVSGFRYDRMPGPIVLLRS